MGRFESRVSLFHVKRRERDRLPVADIRATSVAFQRLLGNPWLTNAIRREAKRLTELYVQQVW